MHHSKELQMVQKKKKKKLVRWWSQTISIITTDNNYYNWIWRNMFESAFIIAIVSASKFNIFLENKIKT